MAENSFIETVASRLVSSSFGKDFSDVAVVFPNRRAGLFLRKHLAGIIREVTWAPAVFSVEDFITGLSGLEETGQLDALTELYLVHLELEGKNASGFGEFLNWGPQLLADFNEIDRYLVDPGTLFTYLDQIRTLTVWNPDSQPPTEFQLRYLKFYRSMLPCYQRFRERLLGAGKGYQGLIFRVAAEKMEQNMVSIPWKHVLFAGFNALTAAEEKVAGILVERGLASMIWDTDAYYMEDKKQEAGRFLRQWKHRWPSGPGQWISGNLATAGREVTVTGVPGVAGQVKRCGEILAGMEEHLLNETTAVVMPDENLLLPLLNSLPGSVREVNITMGLPLGDTPMADFFDLLFIMHLNTFRIPRLRELPGKYYYRDLLKLLRHPYVQQLGGNTSGGSSFACQRICEKISSGNMVFLSREDLIHTETGVVAEDINFISILLEPWNGFRDAILKMQGVLSALIKATVKEEDGSHGSPGIVTEYGYALARLLNQFAGMPVVEGPYLDWETFYRFFRQLLRTSRLPFYGEPLSGIQIMGMLETRNLDFSQVIILSCNEGILPAGRSAQSFIPFDVRREFRLPTYRYHDAVYAYHFYRLIQRARKVWILYNTQADSLGGGEVSRFVKQMESELVPLNVNMKWHTELLSTPLRTNAGMKPPVIHKTGDVWKRMLEKAGNGLSPTALNNYRRCPLRFYFNDIIGLKEPEEHPDGVDPRALGEAVHAALCALLSPFRGKTLTGEALAITLSSAGKEVGKAFAKKFGEYVTGFGKSLLMVEVARMMTEKFLESEIRHATEAAAEGSPLQIIMLEQPLVRDLTSGGSGQPASIRLKGFADRIDRKGEIIRIVDYKTGRIQGRDLQVKDWQDLISDPGCEKAFQLAVYAWLLAERYPGKQLQAGIISLRQPSAGLYPLILPGMGTAEESGILRTDLVEKIGASLQELLQEIYDPGRPFEPVADEKECRLCPFRAVCGR